MRIPALSFLRYWKKPTLLIGRTAMYCYANKKDPVIGRIEVVSYSERKCEPFSDTLLTVVFPDGTFIRRNIKSWMIIK